MKSKSVMLVIRFLTVLAFLLPFALGKGEHPPATPATPAESWQNAPDEFLNSRWHVDKLDAVKAQWQRMRDGKMSSALFVVDSGYVILQLGDAERPIKCHSVRKSFLNGLYGVLHRKGKLDLDKNLEELGVDDITPLNAEEKKATLHQLMQCRSGIYLPAEAETSAMKKKKPERGSHATGTYYYYNNWDFNALGEIYKQLADSDLFEDFNDEIAGPLQMQDFDQKRHTWYHHDGSDDDDRQSDYPAYHFRLSARDRARFGLLFLRKGNWNGEQLIPKDWVELSTRAYSTHETDPEQLGSGQGYGMLWWVSDTGWLYGQKFSDKPFSARGNGGQFIALIPSQQLVIAHANDTSVKGWSSSGTERNKLIELLVAARK